MRRFLRDNALSLTMIGCFLVFWAAQSVSGWHANNADNREHHQPPQSYRSYLTSGHFVEATAENWESEFLQMSGYVLLTAFLRQRGSPESKPMADNDADEDPRQASGRPRGRPAGSAAAGSRPGPSGAAGIGAEGPLGAAAVPGGDRPRRPAPAPTARRWLLVPSAKRPSGHSGSRAEH